MTYAQMDTVEGKKGGKVILSMHLVNMHFHFYFLLNDKSAKFVTNKLNALLRYILPNGISFENLTQDKLNSIISHIKEKAQIIQHQLIYSVLHMSLKF